MMLEGPNNSSGHNTEPPPMDYYRASYAFLVRIRMPYVVCMYASTSDVMALRTQQIVPCICMWGISGETLINIPYTHTRANNNRQVQQGNHQQAASDLYRLVQRLEAAAAYEDSLPRLHRCVSACMSVWVYICVC